MSSKGRPTVYPRDLHLAENLSPEQAVLRDALVKLDRATGSDGYEYTETVSAMEYVSEEFTEVARAFAALLNAEPAPAGVIDREAIAKAAWTSYDGEQSWDELCALAEQKPDGDYADIRDGYLGEADRILTILPGRTVAQVKAEALREAAATATYGDTQRRLNARADQLEREDKR